MPSHRPRVHLKAVLPFLAWFDGYRSVHLKRDVIGGLTVALVLIPQSMAYAQLAGLPPYYGLYAAFVPPIVAAMFGSSSQLATGPVAVVSLLTAVALEPLATTGSDHYIAYAILLAFLVGTFQLGLGMLRLGLLVNLLSHPVVNGFSNAAAVIIATSQLPKIFGVTVEKSERHYQTVWQTLSTAAESTHWPTFALGMAAFVIMVLLKRIAPKAPNVLAAVLITTWVSWASGFDRSARVPLSDVHAPEVKVRIAAFNRGMDQRDRLVAEKTILRKRRMAAEAADDRIGAVNLARDADILDIRIGETDRAIAELRRDIRRRMLAGGVGTDGRLSLFAGNVPPAGIALDGRTWRIRVGSAALDPAYLAVAAGGEVVGHIPGGLPAVRVPRFERGTVAHLFPFAVVISLLGFMESISIAKAMAAKTGQRIDPDQELIGQGLGNMFGALVGSYPTAGSFSRSAVNLQAGAVSGLSGVFTGFAVLVALMAFTPMLYHLPQSVLAAIIMMAVMGLINIRGILHAWRAQWYDGAIAVITLIATLAFAPHLERGIAVGVVLSLSVFLYKSMRPSVVDLSLGSDRALHDAVAYGLAQCRYIDVVRFDGPLFFANASYLEEQIRKRRTTKKRLKHIIIVANGINDIDASGEEALSLTVDRVRSAGIGISISGVNEAVAAVFRRTFLLAKIGEKNLHPTLNAAIAAVHHATHKDGGEEKCPLKIVITSSADPSQKGA